ncbi:MAG: alpha/beta hydrolase [Chloroflexi bacterium]|nr:alpha/beta hydrolase [Chloroflexota bacterium]
MKNTLQVSESAGTQFAYPLVNFVRRGKGSPVILAHGLAASLHDWDDLLPELEGVGFSGFALDLLGHGESYKPFSPNEYTVGTVFDHFSTWIDSLLLQEPMILVGHSLGGGLSLMYARAFPERVRAIVLINPFYDLKQLPSVLRAFFRRPLMNTHLIERTPYRLFRMLVDLSSFNVQLGHRETHLLPERVREQTALDYKRAAPGIYNIPRTLPGLADDLPQIHHPALLIWGDRDQTLAPESFIDLTRRLPNLKSWYSLPACGHVPHQCHPHTFNPHVLDFLKSI